MHVCFGPKRTSLLCTHPYLTRPHLAPKKPWCLALGTGSMKQASHSLQKWRGCWVNCALFHFQMQLNVNYHLSCLNFCVLFLSLESHATVTPFSHVSEGWCNFSRWYLTVLLGCISPDFWSHFPSQRHGVHQNSLPRKKERGGGIKRER